MPLVLVPGLLCTPAVFAAVRPGLAGPATEVSLAVSDDWTAIARDILAAAPARFVALGMSMGSYLGFELFRQAPERIAGLILIGTSARADTPKVAGQREKLAHWALGAGAEQLAQALEPVMLTEQSRARPGIVACLRDMARDIGVETFATHQRAIARRPDSRPTLPRIDCPVLVMTGEEDRVTLPELGREVADTVPDGHEVVIPGAAHFPLLERPDAVTGHVNAFLQRI